MLAAPPEELGRKSDAEPQLLGTVAPGRGRSTAADDLIHVELALSGSLRPVISEDGLAIDFEAPGGARVVHYAELAVTDARGESLAAWMEGYAGVRGGGIRIVIDDAGAVYPITVDPLATSPAWTAESDQAGAWFGFPVATAGDVNGDGYSDVIVGADGYDNGQTDEGRAYVYLGSAAGLAANPAWTAESDQASAYFGIAVATAGDVNGDGYADVIVGANRYDNGETDEGRAYVYLGSAAGLAATAAWTAESDQAGASFGYSVATAEDVNGDGYADVIVGAYLYDNGQPDEGRAYVYLGSAAGLATTATWTAESDQMSANFGYSMAPAGDVNGDGFADVIVGAYAYDNGQTDEGRAYLYLGSAAGLAATAAWTAESDQARAWFGYSVAPAGDVNGDGYADVIVGAPYYAAGQTDEGRAYVYLGSAAGLAATAAWTAESDQAGAIFGASVATAGDVNGDGYADVIVGAHFYDNGQPDEGRAFVYLGSATGPAATAAWTAESDQAGAWFGTSVATAGDVNGDGYADVIVGAPYYDNGQPDEGRAYVFLGSAAGPAATAGWTAESDQASAYFGYSVATAGDVNGDGYADVIVGAYAYDNGQTDEGRAYVYLGSAAGLVAAAAWTAESDQAGGSFGYVGRHGRGRQRGRVRGRDRGCLPLRQRPTGPRPGVPLPRLGRGPRGDGHVDGGERPGRSQLRRLGRHGRGRQRGRVRGRDRGGVQLRQRPAGRRARLRLPGLGRGPGDDGHVDGGERPGKRLLRRLGRHGRGRQRGRVRGRDRGGVLLQQRPDGRRARLRLPRLGRGPGDDGHVEGGERPGIRQLRRLGRHGRGRQRGRVRGRDRGGVQLRQRARRTKGAPTSTWARPRAWR